jgi:hypothetical protein
MYYDSKLDRVLLRDGNSVVSEFTYAKFILDDVDLSGVYVDKSFSSDVYEALYGDSIDKELSSIELTPPEMVHTNTHLDLLIDTLEASSRFLGTDGEISRISLEIEFFSRTNNILFLLNLVELIKRFKEDNVVWGVGRGSACSSFVLFLLYVHDVNPLKYGISFSELSKELNYEIAD